MANFFAVSVKRTALYSPEDLNELVQTAPVGPERRRQPKAGPVTIKWLDSAGNSKFCGGPGVWAILLLIGSLLTNMIGIYFAHEGPSENKPYGLHPHGALCMAPLVGIPVGVHT